MTVALREKDVGGANGTICFDPFIRVRSQADKDTLDEGREVMR